MRPFKLLDGLKDNNIFVRHWRSTWKRVLCRFHIRALLWWWYLLLFGVIRLLEGGRLLDHLNVCTTQSRRISFFCGLKTLWRRIFLQVDHHFLDFLGLGLGLLPDIGTALALGLILSLGLALFSRLRTCTFSRIGSFLSHLLYRRCGCRILIHRLLHLSQRPLAGCLLPSILRIWSGIHVTSVIYWDQDSPSTERWRVSITVHQPKPFDRIAGSLP